MSPVARGGDLLFFLCLNDYGGAEISMITLAKGLLASGKSVSLAVYGNTPELAAKLGFNGNIVNLNCRRTVQAIWPLQRLLARGSYSTLITALTHTNLAALLAAKLSGQALGVIVTEHGMDGIERCASSRAFRFFVRCAYARASSVVAVSKGLAQNWRYILSPRVPVVALYNPIMEDVPSVIAAPAHPWLASKEIPVVMGIGRLKEEKNFSLLIRAFARVAAKRDVRLILIGEGEQRKGLEEIAKNLGVSDKILMPGFVTDPKNWLAYAALLVCSSKKEGLGNVIVEALALGVSVVACDCPYGPSEILEKGRYGRLVPIENEEVLARAIAQTLDKRDDPKHLQERALAFTVSQCIDGYRALIDNPHSAENFS